MGISWRASGWPPSRRAESQPSAPTLIRPATGAPILDGVLAWIECKVFSSVPGGDHMVFIGEIQDGTSNEGTPLVYFRSQYRQLG